MVLKWHLYKELYSKRRDFFSYRYFPDLIYEYRLSHSSYQASITIHIYCPAIAWYLPFWLLLVCPIIKKKQVHVKTPMSILLKSIFFIFSPVINMSISNYYYVLKPAIIIMIPRIIQIIARTSLRDFLRLIIPIPKIINPTIIEYSIYVT